MNGRAALVALAQRPARRLLSQRTRHDLLYDALRLRTRLRQPRPGTVVAPHPRLHFGCGPVRVPGWVNSDLSGSDLDVDLAAARLPWRSGSFEALVGEHVVEHLELTAELLPLLRELRRVARDGAELWVSCPDMEKICRLYLEDGGRSLLADRQARFVYELNGLPAQHIVNDLFHQDGDHKNLYDFELLSWALERSGFGACRRVSERALLQRFPGFPPRRDDAVTLYVTARAVRPVPPVDEAVRAPHWGGARFERVARAVDAEAEREGFEPSRPP